VGRFRDNIEAPFPRAKADTFFAGQLAEKRFQLGPNPSGVGQKRGISHGNLRVGFVDDDQADENFTAYVTLPDDGAVVGPIDLPFELTCELPILVKVRPDSAPAADRHVIATVSIPPLKHRWSATRRVVLPPPGPPVVAVTIPQWVHSLTCCEVDAVVTLFDATGAPLCSLIGPFKDWPRPRLATIMATSFDTPVPVLLSYES